MSTTRYEFGTTLRDATLENAVRRVTNAVPAEGFGVLAEIGLRDTPRSV